MTLLLKAEGVSFGYSNERKVLNNINFELFTGEVICILGSNGCGKSTLLKTLLGENKNYQGKLLLENQDINRLSATEIAKKLTLVFQEHHAPFPYTVLEIVKMGRAPHISLFANPSKLDVEIAVDSLQRVGLYHLKDIPYTKISGGERQLVLIARALAQQTKVILLDEPTSHLDFKNQALVIKVVHQLASENNIGIIMTTHLPDQALMYSSKVALMKGGNFIAFGNGEEVINDDNLESIYGIAVSVLKVNNQKNNRNLSICIPILDSI